MIFRTPRGTAGSHARADPVHDRLVCTRRSLLPSPPADVMQTSGRGAWLLTPVSVCPLYTRPAGHSPLLCSARGLTAIVVGFTRQVEQVASTAGSVPVWCWDWVAVGGRSRCRWFSHPRKEGWSYHLRVTLGVPWETLHAAKHAACQQTPGNSLIVFLCHVQPWVNPPGVAVGEEVVLVLLFQLTFSEIDEQREESIMRKPPPALWAAGEIIWGSLKAAPSHSSSCLMAGLTGSVSFLGGCLLPHVGHQFCGPSTGPLLREQEPTCRTSNLCKLHFLRQMAGLIWSSLIFPFSSGREHFLF